MTSIKALLAGLGLLLLGPVALADDDCPQPAPVTGKPPPAAPITPPAADQPVTIEADDQNFAFDVNGNAKLCGNVVMRQGERSIRTDCLEYNAETQDAKMEGGIVFEDPQLKVTGGSGTYSPTLGAAFEGAQFELPERNARGAAKSMKMDPNGKISLEDVSFSTCPATDRSWELKADEIEIDTRERNGVGRGARVEFQGVPIFYAPWMSFPVGPQRKSGFLFPNVGRTTRSGFELEVPYYFNLRENVDLTLSPIYYSKRGLDAAGELRYLTARQHGSLNFDYLPSDDVADRDRHRVELTHVAELPGDWRFRIDATDVSDSNYFEDFALGPEGTSVPFAERLAEATYRDEHLNVRAQFQQFQTIDDELPEIDRPYARTPRVLASGDWESGLGAINYGFDAEVVNFERDLGVTGWRTDIAPRVGFDWSAPGFFVRPSAGYRYTQYQLRDADPGVDESPTRSMPFASFDTGLVFERATGSHGQRRITLEPRALYLYTPYRNQDALPLFDTGLPDLNLVELYRTNRYVGADRVNDANQVSFGLTSRLFNSVSGAQYLAVSVGQAYYFEKPRVVLPDETPSTRDTSDFIAQVSLTAYKNWNFEAGIQWNPEDTRSERSTFRLQYRPNGDSVVNLAYRAQRDRLEQAEVSTAWPIGKKWNAYGRVVYSLRDGEMLDRFAGFEYKACCFKLRFVGRRFVSSRDGSQETGIYLQLELNGLASVGTPADAFLQRSIRGYSPETSARQKTTP
ncbi:MAG TPA: LPS assembly protein LptD [Steroidobacteraceae bacterium]|nr:LPS assembly protein LptD [Steroidobacteraceae bacterium]